VPPAGPDKKGKMPRDQEEETSEQDSLKRRAEELSALQDISSAVSATLDPGKVLDVALKVLINAAGADGGVAFIWDEIGQVFRHSRHCNVPDRVWFEMRDFRLGEGICGNAAKELRPAVIDDLSRDVRNIFPGSAAAGHRSIAAVPLVAGGRALGLVRVISKARGRFSKKSLQFLRAMGNTVGLALANANLFQQTDERLRRKVKQLEELTEFARRPLSSLEPAEVYSSVASAAAELVDAEKAVLLLSDKPGTSMRGVAGYGFTPEEAKGLVCEHAGKAMEEVISHGRFIHCHSIGARGESYEDFRRRCGVRTVVCFPLFEGARSIGALVVLNTPKPLSDDDKALLSAFADRAVHAVRNTALYDLERRRMREMAAAREIAHAGSAMSDSASTFQSICEAIRKWLRYDFVWLGVMESDSGEVRAVAQTGLEDANAARFHVRTDESILGESVRERKPVWVEDGAKHRKCWPWTSETDSAGPQAAIAVPIEFKDEVRGVIYAGRKKSGPFSEDDANALKLAASEAATALRNSELYAETLDLYSRISHIHNLSREISASLDLNRVLRVACKNAVEALDLKMAWIGLISDESYRVEPVTDYGAEEGYLDAINVTYDESPTGRGPTGTAIRTRKPVVARDLASSPTFSPWRAAAAKRGYRSSCAVPLIASSQVLGALNLYSNKPRAFAGRVVELLEGFAAQAAMAIQNARLHDKIRESENLKDKILHGVPYALFVVDRSGDILMANAATRSVFREGGTSGLRYSELIPQGHPAGRMISSWLDNSQAPDPLRGWFGPAGQARQFLLTESGEVFIGGKPHLLVSVHDATTQKNLDESLEQTDRLSLAGNMAAQLAHEIANPLALMSSQVQRMMESGEAEPGQLERLLSSLDRVASLVDDLSHLGRKTALQRELLDAGSLVREAVKLMEFDNRFRDLKVEVDITPDLPAATLDRDKIAQVLINLLLNAADAMPKGGTISISCRAVKPAVSWNGETFEGQYILLSVRDTGHGIAPNVMKRMWEPFYTTKPVGKGTGLGLAVSMSIVDQHRGYLETRSTPGKGSTFTVWLPVKRWPYCWEATQECTRETHFSCPVFRHQLCHRCWSDPEALCHDSGWSNPFLAKPDALIRET